MEKVINAVLARQQLGQLLEEVYYQHNAVVIERAGRPMAVLVPVEQYRQWQEARAGLFRMVGEARARTASVPAMEIEADIAAAVEGAKSHERRAAGA